jgi:cytochrome c oxidase cbb3-type subunit I/II
VRLVLCDRIARRFAIAALVWGVVALAAGVLLALELLLAPDLPPFLAFGRLRPVHSGLAVFALIGNLVFAGMYHSSQRLLAVRIPFPRLAGAHFLLWQLAAAAAALTAPEWPRDLAIAAAWLFFAVNLFAMVRRRGEARLYVSIWFYIATTVTVPVFHILNSAAPAGGVAGAMVQAWYAQMAIAFFLTMPVLGIVYDLAPRAAARPLHSHRIAVLHFWALVFLYGWAAPQPLLNTALPDWAQVMAAAAGLLLLAPSLAGILNGLLTLRGTGARLRTDPVLKFMAAALFFAAIAALEAPILGTRAGSSLLQYGDWIAGHVHLGALGFDGMMGAALLYWLVPRLFGTELRSRAAAGAHFYLATVGLLLYVSSMWIAGATQGVMLRAEDAAGRLIYTFIETAVALELPWWGRAIGGALYLAGFLVMLVNLVLTIRRGGAVDEELDAAGSIRPVRAGALLLGRPVVVAVTVLALVVAAGLANPLASVGLLMVALLVGLAGAGARALDEPGASSWHQRLEGSGLVMAILVAAAVLFGAAVQLGPVLAAAPEATRAPYTPLEEAGRRVYIAEGCASCHTQMIRPFLWEVARYGEVSTAADSAGDRPALWGSRRIGPDLARIGGRHDDDWHRRHLIDPRTVAFASRMPSYRHLDDGEMTALIAYLQRLGAAR